MCDVEFEALGMEFHDRGRRVEEQIALLRRLWLAPAVTFEGRDHKIVGASRPGAVVLVRAKRYDDATAAVEKAIRLGFSPKRAARDIDLVPLRGRPQYESLVAPAKWTAK